MAELIRRPVTLLWTDDHGATYFVDFEFAFIDGRPECVGLGLRSYSDEESERDLLAVELAKVTGADLPVSINERPPAMTATLLRVLPTGELVRKARRVLVDREKLSADLAQALAQIGEVPDDLVRGRQQMADRVSAEIPKGRRYSTEDYQRAAQVYSDAELAGEPPTKAVAAEFFISKSGAASLVQRLRGMGFLPETTKGQARGLGDKGRRGAAG